MPAYTTKHKIPYPVPTDAQTLFPTTAQQAATKVDQLIPVDNMVTIAGKQYQATGTWGNSVIPSAKWQAYPPMQVATISLPLPYTPPPGYKFTVTMGHCTTYVFCSTATQDNRTISVRLAQVHVTGQGVGSIRWQLVKDA